MKGISIWDKIESGLPTSCDLMVCVLTQQQTVNMVPVDMLRPKEVVMLVTETAKKWVDGSQKFLEGRNIQAKIVKIPDNIETKQEEFVALMEKKLPQLLKGKRVLINIGGGTKLMTYALITFYQRYNKEEVLGMDLVYAELTAHELITLRPDRTDRRKLNANLGLEEIIGLFGFELTEKPKKIDWDNSPWQNSGLFDALGRDDLVYRLFIQSMEPDMVRADEYPKGVLKDRLKEVLKESRPELEGFKSQNQSILALEEVLKKWRHTSAEKKNAFFAKINNPREMYNIWWGELKTFLLNQTHQRLLSNIDSRPLLGEESGLSLNEVKERLARVGVECRAQSYPIYRNQISWPEQTGEVFEKVVLEAMCRILRQRKDIARQITALYTNIKTRPLGSGSAGKQNDSEYDLVLVTVYGTLIMIEAKARRYVGDTAKSKDFGAFQKSGIYGKALIVGPLCQRLRTENGDWQDWVPGFLRDQPETAARAQVTYVLLDGLEAFLEKYFSI